MNRVSKLITLQRSISAELSEHKFCCVSGSEFVLSSEMQRRWLSLREAWNDLAPDKFFCSEDNEKYRQRRYSNFYFSPYSGELELMPHTDYFQSKRQNQYVGGKHRHFGAVTPYTFENPFFRELVKYDFSRFEIGEEFCNRDWIAHIHQIRIVVGPGKTTFVTPEGIHSDGYPFASVHLVNRENVSGGVSTIYNLEKQPLQTVTFLNPLDSLYFEDRQLNHYVTPITGENGMQGKRDILAISFSCPSSPFTVDV